MARAYVGLGANLGDRQRMLESALDRLRDEAGIQVVGVSTLRETAPWGYEQQPPFLNAAAAVETDLPPRELLERLLGIERALGRTRGSQRFGPRTIDLDLLVYGDEVVHQPGLRLPHPRLAERRFALEPLAELDPALVVPGRGTVSALLAELHWAEDVPP